MTFKTRWLKAKKAYRNAPPGYRAGKLKALRDLVTDALKAGK